MKYYADEKRFYAQLEKPGLNLGLVQLVVDSLWWDFGVPGTAVVIKPGLRKTSYYSPPPWPRGLTGIRNPRRNMSRKPGGIFLAPTMMDWLTVAHEVAHHLHCCDYDRRWRQAKKGLPKEKWHGFRHAIYLHQVVKRLRAWGVVPVDNRK
jgi:hypothetical protein